jgi:hypothetical protein
MNRGNPNDFIVDCLPFEGDSGSPVFVHTVRILRDGRSLGPHNELIGVLGGYVSWGDITPMPSKTREPQIDMDMHRQNSPGLARAAPARYIVPAIENYLART